MSNLKDLARAVNQNARESTRPIDIRLPANKRSTLSPEDFELIPRGWIEPYVIDACNAVPAPPLWNVAGALALAAHSLSRWGWTIANGHHARPALAWAIVSESGSGKGLAIGYLRQFLYDFHHHNASEDLKDTCLFDGETNTYKNTLLEFTGTPEGLFWEMEDRVYEMPDGGKRACVLGAHDEMHEIFSRAKQSPIYITDMIAVFDQRSEVRRTQVNIKQLKKAKEGGRTGVILQPTLSALFAAAEPRLREVLTLEHLTGGFCSRLMWLAQPTNWIDPRDSNPEWLRPLAEVDRNRAVYARERYTKWLETLDVPGKLIFTDETIEIHMSTVHKWRADLSTSVLRELVARMDSHLLALAATIAGVEGTIVGNGAGPTIFVEPEHYELAMKIYRRVIAGVLWLYQAGQAKGALAVLHLLEGRPQGLTVKEIGAALHTDYNIMRRLLESLVKDGELVTASMPTNGRTAGLHFHPQYLPRLTQAATKLKGVWVLQESNRQKMMETAELDLAQR